jgi:hypothetical protein
MPSVEQPDPAAFLEGAFRRSGATRTDLLRSAMNAWAPPTVVDLLLGLPEGYYRNVDEVLGALPDAS